MKFQLASLLQQLPLPANENWGPQGGENEF